MQIHTYIYTYTLPLHEASQQATKRTNCCSQRNISLIVKKWYLHRRRALRPPTNAARVSATATTTDFGRSWLFCAAFAKACLLVGLAARTALARCLRRCAVALLHCCFIRCVEQRQFVRLTAGFDRFLVLLLCKSKYRRIYFYCYINFNVCMYVIFLQFFTPLVARPQPLAQTLFVLLLL